MQRAMEELSQPSYGEQQRLYESELLQRVEKMAVGDTHPLVLKYYSLPTQNKTSVGRLHY